MERTSRKSNSVQKPSDKKSQASWGKPSQRLIKNSLVEGRIESWQNEWQPLSSANTSSADGMSDIAKHTSVFAVRMPTVPGT